MLCYNCIRATGSYQQRPEHMQQVLHHAGRQFCYWWLYCSDSNLYSPADFQWIVYEQHTRSRGEGRMEPYTPHQICILMIFNNIMCLPPVHCTTHSTSCAVHTTRPRYYICDLGHSRSVITWESAKGQPCATKYGLPRGAYMLYSILNMALE